MASEPVATGDLPADVDRDAAARGTIYGLLARAFVEPTADLHGAVADGTFATTVADLLAATPLEVDPPAFDTDDDHDTLSARYNDLFVIGFSEVLDRTDGTIDSQGPVVPLYESAYREEVSWNDVNLDLARAYEYFGLEVNTADRKNHDHLRLQLEFAGYLCRREAAVDPEVSAARLDFHDRHLRVATRGVTGRLDAEPGTGFYGQLGRFLDRFTAADVADLAARREAREHGGGA
jgi:DMSO reductase family type II enzyme chaperone